MRLRIPEPFKDDYKVLPKEIKKVADKQIGFLATNLKHPSLQVHKIKGTKDKWEAYVTVKYRMTFQIENDIIILRKIGIHDKVLENP
ncbi:MAG: hypothetical protein AB1630_10780 [bacterium]